MQRSFKNMLRFLAIIGTMTLVFNAAEAQQPKKPHQILLTLKHTLTLIGERNGSMRDFTSAVREAREEIRDYTVKGGDAKDLIERDAQGMTPLIAASFEGYGDIVEEMLTYKLVHQHVNDVDNRGVSALAYANFAFKQSLWLCNPTILKNPYILTPLRVVQPYYTPDNETPYQKARRVLLASDATGTPAQFKTTWLNLCRLEYPVIASKIEGAKDIQQTVVAEAAEALNAYRATK